MTSVISAKIVPWQGNTQVIGKSCVFKKTNWSCDKVHNILYEFGGDEVRETNNNIR